MSQWSCVIFFFIVAFHKSAPDLFRASSILVGSLRVVTSAEYTKSSNHFSVRCLSVCLIALSFSILCGWHILFVFLYLMFKKVISIVFIFDFDLSRANSFPNWSTKHFGVLSPGHSVIPSHRWDVSQKKWKHNLAYISI